MTRQITGAENALPYLTECLPRLLEKEAGAEEEALFDWFLHQPQYREKIQTLVKAATQTRRETGLGRQVAQALYGQNLENSVSRLERYAACAYAHFLMYGLQLKEREEFVFQPVDMGNIFHSVLEKFARKLTAAGYDWFHVPREVQESLTKACVKEAVEEYGGELLAQHGQKRIFHPPDGADDAADGVGHLPSGTAGRFVPSNFRSAVFHSGAFGSESAAGRDGHHEAAGAH